MIPTPRKPSHLDPRAERLLEWLGAQPWAGCVVLGGGVALKHYLDYRSTKDCDAWWGDATPSALKETVLAEIANALEQQNPGCKLRRDNWGEVQSLAVMEAGEAVFAFQIAERTRQLEPYLVSAWGEVLLESLTDNVASKMAALVDRGLGRDFSDIRHLHEQLGWQPAEFWQLWQRRFPGRSVADAQAKARLKLEALMRSRPLEKVQPPSARTALAAARVWFLNDLLTHDSGH